MSLPQQYQWLHTIGTLPKMVDEALNWIGTREIPGAKHNPKILEWARRVGIPNLVKNDEQAWCGLFIAYVATVSGKMIPMKGWDILRALQWVNFGNHTTVPMLGDVLIFRREGGGHVGLYIGEDETHYHVLGGNQNNQVGIVRIEKKKLHTAMRPPYTSQPESVKVYRLAPAGTELKSAA